MRIIHAHDVVTDQVIYIEAAGDAGEEPATLDGKTICDGSTFLETDTKKVKIYNESSETWKEW